MGQGTGTGPPTSVARLHGIAITTAVLALPTLLPGELGWLFGLVPLPVLYFLTVQGPRTGTTTVGAALAIVAGLSLMQGTVGALIFGVTMLPLGSVLARAMATNERPSRAGLDGAIALAVAWLAYWALLGAVQGGNPYAMLLDSLQRGLDATAAMYRQQAEVSIDVQQEVDAIFAGLRDLLPRILPALLTITVLGTVWINMIIGHRLLARHSPPLSPWPPYHRWRLPEPLVWGVIAGGVLMLLPLAATRTIGLNLLCVFGTLYFYQGLAVIAGRLVHWSVPQPIRIIVYALLLLQVYGILLLAVLGLTDVWAEFGRKRPKPSE